MDQGGEDRVGPGDACSLTLSHRPATNTLRPIERGLGPVERAAQAARGSTSSRPIRVKPNRRACAALAGKRSFAADTIRDGNAQIPVIRPRLWELAKSTRSGRSSLPNSMSRIEYRREADIPDRGGGRPIGADSAPPRGASGTPGVRAIAGVPLQARHRLVRVCGVNTAQPGAHAVFTGAMKRGPASCGAAKPSTGTREFFAANTWRPSLTVTHVP